MRESALDLRFVLVRREHESDHDDRVLLLCESKEL